MQLCKPAKKKRPFEGTFQGGLGVQYASQTSRTDNPCVLDSQVCTIWNFNIHHPLFFTDFWVVVSEVIRQLHKPCKYNGVHPSETTFCTIPLGWWPGDSDVLLLPAGTFLFVVQVKSVRHQPKSNWMKGGINTWNSLWKMGLNGGVFCNPQKALNPWSQEWSIWGSDFTHRKTCFIVQLANTCKWGVRRKGCEGSFSWKPTKSHSCWTAWGKMCSKVENSSRKERRHDTQWCTHFWKAKGWRPGKVCEGKSTELLTRSYKEKA